MKRLLIANRGEIAVRIARAAREHGIATIAVYTDPDRDAPHVAAADEAVRIESYLDPLPGAAGRADAVHPGYGFLSENAAFARACLDAGLCWVGPRPEVIAAMGDKVAARATMRRAEVPVVPGVESEDPAEIAAIGFPLLVKAAGGGGGRGMRTVTVASDLADALADAKAEAGAAFGDARVYAERLLVRPRHIEVQILGDAHGTVLHLGERECSIQRRHQKVIEETPSTALSPALRAEICGAAVRAARAVGYTSAGTVEFLLEPDGRFWFLEMNTRIQVEHPITEAVTGVDLVREQLRVAMGERLSTAEVAPRGHAIECRVIAEDANYLPSPGRISRWRPPAGPGIRVDAGVGEGFVVPDAYDPLLAKLIAHGADRPAAIARMRAALREFVVLGIATNLELLLDVVSSDAFARGDTCTDFLDRAAWRPPEVETALYLAAHGARGIARGQSGGSESSPWSTLGRWP